MGISSVAFGWSGGKIPEDQKLQHPLEKSFKSLQSETKSKFDSNQLISKMKQFQGSISTFNLKLFRMYSELIKRL